MSLTVYNFKKYYLINSNWLNEYKEYFLYDTIKKKLSKYKDYSYNRIKTKLNIISKKEIGQIKLYQNTKISDNLRDASNLKCKNNKIELVKNVNVNEDLLPLSIEYDNKYYNTPQEFELH